jgi:hypothetical protein
MSIWEYEGIERIRMSKKTGDRFLMVINMNGLQIFKQNNFLSMCKAVVYSVVRRVVENYGANVPSLFTISKNKRRWYHSTKYQYYKNLTILNIQQYHREER